MYDGFLWLGWSLCIITFIVCLILYTTNHRLRKRLQFDCNEYLDTMRLQQGMTFKFKKIDGHFIHTFCEGKLVYKVGSDSQEIVGKTLADFLDDEEYIAYKESFYERAWQGQEVSYEGKLNDVWYLASLSPIFKDNQVYEVIASCVDITQQKVAEQEIRKTEQMYRMIAESSTDLIRIIGADMTIRYASPSHFEVLGYTPSELEGTKCARLVHPIDRQAAVNKFYEAVHKKIDHYKASFHAQHKDGTPVMLETHGRPLLDENGKISEIVVISRDLTKRLEEDQEHRRRDKLSLAGQLAAGIAHEIRNPLTAIKGFTQLLRTPSERQTFYAEVVMAELARVEAIVNEFLLLAKPEAAQFQQHDILGILSDVVTLLGPQALLQKVQVHTETQFDRLSIFAAASQLKQVFINILKNSIESMPDGGNVYVHLSLRDDGNTFIVRIQDEGCGIPDELLDRLGEPFYTTKEKGTGLGLMVSYKIVKDHGGEIIVHSSSPKGTCIEITLPIEHNSVLSNV